MLPVLEFIFAKWYHYAGVLVLLTAPFAVLKGLVLVEINHKHENKN